MFRITITILFFLSFVTGFSQSTFFSQANVYVSDSAQIHVFGIFENNGDSSYLQNFGLIQTYDDSQQDGNFEINNSAIVLADSSRFKISKDWVNNGTLNILSGETEMYGDNQKFSGDSVSSFWNLTLTGTDIKEQEQDIRVRSVLNLNDRELAVQDKILYLDNHELGAIDYDSVLNQEGRISTDNDGVIRRVVQLFTRYTIPTGSSDGQSRFRPIKVYHSNGSIIYPPISDTVLITFHNHSADAVNASISDIDTSICRVQDDYFWTFNSIQQDSRYDLDFAYNSSVDGEYTDVGRWNNPTWKREYGTNNYSQGYYEFVRAENQGNFIDEHYALVMKTPRAPEIIFDSTECYSWADYSIENINSNFDFTWEIINSDNSAIIESGQGSNEISTNWNENIGGWVYAQYTNDEGCLSHQDSVQIEDVSVDANFSYVNDKIDGFATQYHFTNLSSGNSNLNEVQWNIDGNSEFINYPQASNDYSYTFDGQLENYVYETSLIVYNWEHGCTDTMTQFIQVIRPFVIYIPNSFSPDNNGFNDVFQVVTSDIDHIDVQIFNRWGEIIFNGSANQAEDISWDGTYHGNKVPTGSYTYRVRVIPRNPDVSHGEYVERTGHINVLY